MDKVIYLSASATTSPSYSPKILSPLHIENAPSPRALYGAGGRPVLTQVPSTRSVTSVSSLPSPLTSAGSVPSTPVSPTRSILISASPDEYAEQGGPLLERKASFLDKITFNSRSRSATTPCGRSYLRKTSPDATGCDNSPTIRFAPLPEGKVKPKPGSGGGCGLSARSNMIKQQMSGGSEMYGLVPEDQCYSYKDIMPGCKKALAKLTRRSTVPPGQPPAAKDSSIHSRTYDIDEDEFFDEDDDVIIGGSFAQEPCEEEDDDDDRTAVDESQYQIGIGAIAGAIANARATGGECPLETRSEPSLPCPKDSLPSPPPTTTALTVDTTATTVSAEVSPDGTTTDKPLQVKGGRLPSGAFYLRVTDADSKTSSSGSEADEAGNIGALGLIMRDLRLHQPVPMEIRLIDENDGEVSP